MQGLAFVLLFTALTFLSWGAYGPLLRYGTAAMGHDGLKAFVGVGLAYFFIAVVVPFWILRTKGEKGRWTFLGTTYSVVAGSVGAIGALGIILALVFKGNPVYVMPLVFGFAPIVNTLVTAWMGGTLNKISPVFVTGIVAAALGAGGVLYFKPPVVPNPGSAPQVRVPAAVKLTATGVAAENSTSRDQADSANQQADSAKQQADSAKQQADSAKQQADSAHQQAASSSAPNLVMIGLSVLMAALCWGSYGPMLHQGQAKMGGSRLRPFACVGIAYFIIAVAAPLILLKTNPAISQGAWTGTGLFWSVVAGAAGAIGALGIILAFNAGGKPIYVMPLVFGFAPVINTFISLTEAGAWADVKTMFWVSLAVVILGAITVLITAPKAAHGPPPAAAATR